MLDGRPEEHSASGPAIATRVPSTLRTHGTMEP